ncbi:entericidin A/B family lipoprotein [Caldimonas caldifontis]|uniref:Entericidin n=1 Tax=Caldimonas caldifontis TaxID=1452508 RepID=A0A2S5SYE9_9BURK|nr:entericidin A/B family lipoprotein [Caldimonas caldifontis]PPE67760.1 entericidin [Caldimonas caldifontis]
MKHLWIVLMLASFGLTGCNTIQGLGKDVQKVGETMEEAASRKK